MLPKILPQFKATLPHRWTYIFNLTNPIIPTQPSLSKSESIDDIEFVINNNIYSNDSFQNNESEIMILDKGFLRSVRFGNLLIKPIDYNPIQNKIKFIKSLNFKIHFDNANIELTNEMKSLYYSPYFEPVYNQIINHE